MVKLVYAPCVVVFLAACLRIWKGKKKGSFTLYADGKFTTEFTTWTECFAPNFTLNSKKRGFLNFLKLFQ